MSTTMKPTPAELAHLVASETLRILTNQLWLNDDPRYKYGLKMPRIQEETRSLPNLFYVSIVTPRNDEEAERLGCFAASSIESMVRKNSSIREPILVCGDNSVSDGKWSCWVRIHNDLWTIYFAAEVRKKEVKVAA